MPRRKRGNNVKTKLQKRRRLFERRRVKEMRGFLRGINTAVPRETDRV